MRIEAFAKINWALNVAGLRPDGYHFLDMLIQRVSLSDTLSLFPHTDIRLEITGMDGLPADERNLAFKAALALKEYTGYPGGASILLDKRIPSQAGLGGGSADAAAVLLGLNRLWNLGFSIHELGNIGVRLGADVPCCLRGGLTRVRGIGEQVTPLPGAQVWHLVILKPTGGLSTKEVFTCYDRQPDDESADIERAGKALRDGAFVILKSSCHNQLQKTAVGMQPSVQTAIDDLLHQGAVFAQMSGSGSAVFGLFHNKAKAESAKASLSPGWPVCLYATTLG